MIVSFNWYKYSFIFGILKKGIKQGSMSASFREAHSGKQAPGDTRTFAEDTFFLLSRTAINELKPRIREVAIKKLGKQGLLLSLQRLLRPYASLKALQARAFRVAVNNVIEKESATYCSIHLNNEDLQLLWHDLR